MVLSFTIDKFSYLTGRILPPFFEHSYRFVYSQVETVKKIENVKHPAFRETVKAFGNGMPLEIHHHGDLPPRSGVGSSSSFVVGLINLLDNFSDRQSTALELAQKSIYIEQELLKENVGCQDQMAAAFGGFNTINFLGVNYSASAVRLSIKKQEELENRCYLVFTGIQRNSSDITQGLLNNFYVKKRMLSRIVSITEEAVRLFEISANLDFVGELLGESWALKKQSNSEATNADLDRFIDQGISSGAQAAKILGAGGGGFVLFWLPTDSKERFSKHFNLGVHVPFKIEYTGSRILRY